MTDSADDDQPGSSKRFAFGANWTQFLTVLNDDRIQIARQSVQTLLQQEDLSGKSLLDIGSGSGLFSLAAHQLGATVTSFDFDPQSVACTQELRRRYAADSDRWTICQGSVLDADFLKTLSNFDVVYSWGVLHHTGDLWQALRNASSLVRPEGLLAISIYNDQGSWSRRWTFLKRTYNRLPDFLKPVFAVAVMGSRELWYLLLDTIRLRPWNYFRNIANYSRGSLRGMSYWYDLKDWIGGYPFQVARPEEIFDFFRREGFVLEKLSTCGGGHGCNEFLFRRKMPSA
ncbi:MAG: class I SAM-dependent methyltransferase [Planctomycetaceae bacterium]